jgi:hypothetical protein
MAPAPENCLAAQDAQSAIGQLQLEHNALARRFGAVERDMRAVTDRVSEMDGTLRDHTSMTQQAVAQMSNTINQLSDTVSNLAQTVSAAISAPVVISTDSPRTLEKWKVTPVKEKFTIGGAIVAILMMPDALKALGSIIYAALKPWLHLP